MRLIEGHEAFNALKDIVNPMVNDVCDRIRAVNNIEIKRFIDKINPVSH